MLYLSHVYHCFAGGIDYDSGPYTIMFPTGERRVPFNVTINGDSILEGNEKFLLIINDSLPRRVTVGKQKYQTEVTIVDNDSMYNLYSPSHKMGAAFKSQSCESNGTNQEMAAMMLMLIMAVCIIEMY